MLLKRRKWNKRKTRAKKDEDEAAQEDEEEEPKEGKRASKKEQKTGEKKDCTFKFKGIGCYNDKKDARALPQRLIKDNTMLSKNFNTELPSLACSCAKNSIDNGNAIFALSNTGECWTGPDDSKYDANGVSDSCVTFDKKKCAEDSELCTGKEGGAFVYYVDHPAHTKTEEEKKAEEVKEYEKKVKEQQDAQEELNKKEAAKVLKKKGKKEKKSKKEKKAKKSHKSKH